MRLSCSLVLVAVAATAAARVDGANFCDLIRCSSKVEPVCATNGVSFDNACMFQIAKCHNDKLAIAATGRCAAAVTEKPAVAANTTTVTPVPVASATAVPVPAAQCEMMCLDMVEPVCGSDGKTYSNKCQLSLANCNNKVTNAGSKTITVAAEGECSAAEGGGDKPTDAPVVTVAPAPTEAPAKKNETSGDADTSGNATTAPPPRDDATEPARLCEMMCPMSFQPVCGSDGVTYANACELRRASCQSRVALTQVAEGECAGADAQGPTAAPAATTSAPAPAPASTTSCRRACTKIMKPVCGSDGVTYNNKCEFEIAKCTKRIATMSFKDGECAAADAVTPTKTPTPAPAPAANTTTTAPAPAPAATTTRKCSQMCTEQYAPVCGTDGKTYSNKCHFNIALCKLGTTATLAVASEGECTAAAADADAGAGASANATAATSSCPRACTQILKPVCGSDGITYNNKCEFEVAKCTKRIASSMMTFKEGECA